MKISPLAGRLAPSSILVNVPRLVAAYYTVLPDPSVPEQRVAFGTSGHRGCAFDASFNEWHVLAISQAICEYRAGHGINGPLFIGIDTHALSEPAYSSALEVLAANGIEVMLAEHCEYTPTPAVSLAILMHNRRPTRGLADGIIITPSHNPPDSGGFKYNQPNGGPADTGVTDWIQAKANDFLMKGLNGVKRVSLKKALNTVTTHHYDYLNAYVNQLDQVIDMAAIKTANIRLGVDPLGGAGVHYWSRIAERYHLNLSIISDQVDPTFRFMAVDWDGRIRMDPSSPYAMQTLIDQKDRYDIAFACDTDHDRHGIVTPSAGLLPPNHFMSVAIDYLFRHRPQWPKNTGVGKTVVSSQMIDRVCARLGRRVFEVPVGFKWFSAGLCDGSLGFCGEESAGASFLRLDGSVWTTDKDGLVPALLAAEMTARNESDPGESYRALANELGNPVADRVEAPATPTQKKKLTKLSPRQVQCTELAGEKILSILTHAPGNDTAIGGVKVITNGGWFAARPSGTEDIYKIYAESFHGEDHLQRIIKEAQMIVNAALAAGTDRDYPSYQPATPSRPDSVLEQKLIFSEATLEAQLASTQAQLIEARDAFMRASADGENIRRRAQEDVAKAHKFAVVSFAEAMIPVKDSLEMALMLDTPSLDLMKEGIELTLKQLTSAFERHGLMEIQPVRGDGLDPMKHQAVALVPANDQETNTVVTVLQKGYMIADRLLRPAIVTAAQEKSSEM